MRYLLSLIIISALLNTACSNVRPVNYDKDAAVSQDSEIAGKSFQLKYLNSAVFDKTITMYAVEDAAVVDINVSKGMSINDIPKRLDDIFVAAVDNGAEFNLVDERDEVKMRSVAALMALVSAYSNYSDAKAAYHDFLDDRARAKLGNYIINLYYNVENGDISHIMFTRREAAE